jgi:SAM-dependent methyltransferase
MKRADDLRTLYGHRFSADEVDARERVWRAACEQFLQRYVRASDTVLDVAAGDAVFLRHIRAARRIAVDLRADVDSLAAHGIEAIACAAQEVGERLPATADVVFVSNFLEHLRSKDEVIDVLRACFAATRPGGRVLVLQPNARFVGGAYWDFIDHHVALTERSVAEALDLAGYTVEEVIPRFLPYTSKSRLSALSRLAPLYMRVRPLWSLFGGQAFVVGRRPSA